MTRLAHSAVRFALFSGVLGTMMEVGFSSSANAFEVAVAAAKQTQPAGPVFVQPKATLDATSSHFLVNKAGEALPAQLDHEGRLWWWSPARQAGDSVSYTVETKPAAAALQNVKLEEVKDGVINVTVGGKPFTAFNFGKDLPKPFLYPVLGPTGDPVTRDYPMKDNDLEKQKKRQDHHHHRSIWTAHGDVRTKDFDKTGSNYWNDALEKGDDPERVKRIVRVISGPVFGQVEAEIEWMNDRGQRELTENQTYTFFRSDESSRIMDVRVLFKFTDGDVMFADTKEGGIVAIRTAVTMDEIGGGKMCNSEGAVGEKECWGKPADWCDYVGQVNGKTVGIAVFDAPTNFRHPTPWHIRGYGLFAANPFGIGQFANDKSKNGGKLWKKGETVEFNYRIFIHKGDTAAAKVADQYRLYADPSASADK